MRFQPGEDDQAFAKARGALLDELDDILASTLDYPDELCERIDALERTDVVAQPDPAWGSVSAVPPPSPFVASGAVVGDEAGSARARSGIEA